MKKAENELSSYSGILSAFVGKAPKEMKPKEEAVEEPRGDQQIRKLSGYEWAGMSRVYSSLVGFTSCIVKVR